MGYEAMVSDVSVPANSKDLGKKKRANRSSKQKQCKLDARREQWLSQGIGGLIPVSPVVDQSSELKGKVCKVEPMAASPTSPPSFPISLPREGQASSKSRWRETEQDVLNLHDSDTDSAFRSPASSASRNSSRKDSSSNSFFSRSSTQSGSQSNSDADEENGALDDWEAVADVISADNEYAGAHPVPGTIVAIVESPKLSPAVASNARSQFSVKHEGSPAVPRAWRPDDAFRPQSLPNLPKQRSLPMNMERHCSSGFWSCHTILAVPTSCPICCEDLDSTDSRFLPCLCGFRLCLFCHKRILEADGRCPGCRKQYSSQDVGGQIDTSVKGMPLTSLRLPHSFSMSSRS